MLRTSCILVCLAALAGCGGGGDETSTPSEETHAGGEAHHEGAEAHAHGGEEAHHGGEGGHEHHFPPAVEAFHDVLAPAWHSDPGEARRAAGCDAVASMRERAAPIAAETPEGVDADAWSSAAEALAGEVDSLGETCESEPDAAEARLEAVHDAFHALVELVGHE
jgi:hypothetical protein